jgi:HEAT repeat protein
VVIIGKTGDEEALNYLEKVLDDEDPDVRERAANVLKDSEHDTNESAENGLKTVKIVSDTEKTAQHRLEEVIERIGNDEAIDVLVEALEHENPEIRHRSAEILGDIGDERAVKPLINALKDKKSSVQWRAGEAIKKLGTPSVIYLIDALDDEDENVRSRSAWALGEIRDKRAVKPLMEKLKDKNASVRWKTAIALSKFGKESFDYLLDALKYENVMVREKAAEALGEMGDPAALDALENALLDKDIYVRRSAEDAIKIIKSKN